MRDHIAYETADDRVAALLAAAAAPSEAPVPGEAEALAAYRRATESPAQLPRRRMKTRTTAKLAAVTALSAMSLVGGGYAVAATNTLPGAAAQAAFEAVGVTVHGKSAQAHSASGEHGKSAEAKARTAARKAGGGDEVDTTSSDHGKTVSTFAKDTLLTGREKGQAIAAIASAKRQDAAASKRQDGAAPEGKRQDGEHSSTQRGTAGDPGDDTEGRGAGSSATGRATATTKSGGASGAGAGNADTERP